jgi:hypothetical protein
VLLASDGGYAQPVAEEPQRVRGVERQSNGTRLCVPKLAESASTFCRPARTPWCRTVRKERPGDSLARIPRATTKTKDITGGLPRVVELFEARHPRDKAVITEVDRAVHHGLVAKGMRRIVIEKDDGTRHEYSVPRSVHVKVQEGKRSAPATR